MLPLGRSLARGARARATSANNLRQSRSVLPSGRRTAQRIRRYALRPSPAAWASAGLMAGLGSSAAICVGSSCGGDGDDTPAQEPDGPLQRWMARKGVTASDIPRVVGQFYIAKNCLFVLGLGLCVRYRPLRALFRSGRPRRWLEGYRRRFPNFYAGMKAKILRGAESLAQYERSLPPRVCIQSR